MAIRMEPQELRDAASDLLGQKEEIFGILQSMNGKIDALDWQGTSQQKFLDLWKETYDGVHNMLEETVKGISDALKGAADTLEQVDNDLFK